MNILNETFDIVQSVSGDGMAISFTTSARQKGSIVIAGNSNDMEGEMWYLSAFPLNLGDLRGQN